MTEKTADTVTARYNIIQHSIYNYIYNFTINKTMQENFNISQKKTITNIMECDLTRLERKKTVHPKRPAYTNAQYVKVCTHTK